MGEHAPLRGKAAVKADTSFEDLEAGILPGETTAGDNHRRKIIVRAVTLALWAVVLAMVVGNALRNPSPVSLFTALGFVVLFVLIYVQIAMMYWSGRRQHMRLGAKLKGAGYISDLGGLPNRNYLLAELRREMPRARGDRSPFTLLLLTLDDLEGVRDRRGDDFVERTLDQMVETLRRMTRNSDFLAHLGDGRFCVMLVECPAREALKYLERLPGSVAVSDGRHMLDVPITARLAQYDMESLYATDVLAEAEEARPLQRRKVMKPDAQVA